MTTDFRALLLELVETWDSFSYADAGDATDRMSEAVEEARAALAEPEPPAEGEVAELVALLRREADVYNCHDHTVWLAAADLRRAADLLEYLAEPEPMGPTDEELKSTARDAEVQYMRQQGGLGGDANNMARQIQQQRIAGLRAVLARWGRQPAPDA